MKRFLAYLLIVGSLGCKASGASDPFGSSANPNNIPSTGLPTATPTPSGPGYNCTGPVSLPVYTIMNNNVVGTWLGLTLTAEFTDGGFLSPGPMNTVNGNPSSMQLTVPCAPCPQFSWTPFIRFTTCPVSQLCQQNIPLPTCYFKRGSIEFDFKVDLPLAEVGDLWVYWGSTMCMRSFRIDHSQLSNGFTHYSIQLDAFSSPSCQADMATPFQVNLMRATLSATNQAFSIDGIQWIAP